MNTIIDDLIKALEQIADEQKVYKGHGDYDILPFCDADEAQKLARSALAIAKRLGPAELVIIDKYDNEKFADGMIYSSTEKPTKTTWKGETRHQALIVPIIPDIQKK
jgi:hypothetical protein